MSDPTQVGNWVVERRVGAGSLGPHFAVRNAYSGRRGFLKTLPRQLGSASHGRFARELQVLQRLPHGARVPELLEAREESPLGPYLVVEWIDGKTLADVLDERGRLHHDEAFAATRAIAITLSILHEAGFLHRDIKPSNVMIPSDGESLAFDRAMLLDFGLAGILRAGDGHDDMARTHAGGVIGTPLYMSPEQLRGMALGPASDVWGAATTLHEMLTGEPPFRADAMPMVVMRIVTEPYRPPAGIDARLSELLLRCFEKDETRRIRDGAALLEALHAVDAPNESPSTTETSGDAPPMAAPPPTFPSLRPPSALDAMACTAVGFVALAVGTALDARHETAMVDSVIAGSLVAIGLAGGGLWREWSLERRLRPARPISALRRRVASLREEERGLSQSVAIELDDLIRVLELNAVDGWHTSQALRLYRPYQDARERGHDDDAIIHVGPLMQFVEGQLPWVVRNATAIGNAVRWGALALAGALLIRAGWIALAG
ncbi:MAG: serine/threonine-protein kinase [Sandaracinaceae bacterium]